MRILHVIDGLGRGGAESLLINSIQLQPADEHVVICLSHLYDFDEGLKKQFSYYTIPVGKKLKIPGAIFKINRIIKKHRPHIIHAHLPLSGIITKLAAPKKIPFFYTIHSEYSICYFNKNRLLKFLEKFTARPYHHLIGVSKIAIDDYVKHITGSGSRDVLYNFVAERFFNQDNKSAYKPGMPLHCIAVGHLKYEKNYSYILQQFGLIKNLPITIDLYGEGDEAEKLKKIKYNKELLNVTFKGKHNNIDELMGQYDLFISCSVTEGFGIAALEAMAAKLPVAVSSIPVFKEIITGVGIFIELGDAPPDVSLAGVLKNIYTGEINIANNIEPAFEKAKKIAAPQNYIVQLKSIYQKYI